MKIVVIGGSGLIGSKLVTNLDEHGHEAVAASPDSGVNMLSGEGLAEALAGAALVVDVSNSPSFEDAAALEFFEASPRWRRGDRDLDRGLTRNSPRHERPTGPQR